jgi:hypothetical protein
MRKNKLEVSVSNTKGKIIDYLIVKHLEDPNFEAPAAQKVRRAWILAKSEYDSMSEERKKKIWEKIARKI